jgi:hypothetical protein
MNRCAKVRLVCAKVRQVPSRQVPSRQAHLCRMALASDEATALLHRTPAHPAHRGGAPSAPGNPWL